MLFEMHAVRLEQPQNACYPAAFAVDLDARRRGPSVNSQHSNGWIDDGSSSAGLEGGDEGGSQEHTTEAEAALAQGIASSLRTLVIASFRAPPNKFVLGETNRGVGGDE